MNKNSTIRNCQFAFKCKVSWDELAHTHATEIRFCRDCQREVYFCYDDDELAEAIRLNRCVAIQQDTDFTPLLGEPI